MADSFLGYKKLIAWQKADEFAHSIYDATQDFPRDEVFGITSQIRRAALSVPTNITEGHARNSKKEFHRFLSIAIASLVEVEYLLDFSFRRNYIKDVEYRKICSQREEVGRILWKLFISQK